MNQVFNSSIEKLNGFELDILKLKENQKRVLVAELFEQYLLFDRLVIRTGRLNSALIFLIQQLGLNRVEELLERRQLEVLLWTPMIITGQGKLLPNGSVNEEEIKGKPPISAASLGDKDAIPERNVDIALNYFRIHRDRKRIFKRKAIENYIVPSGLEFSQNAASLVIDSYKSDTLFERIDKSIALLEENIKHTQDLMASVLDDEFGKLKEEELKVSDFYIDIQTGKTPPSKVSKYYENGIIDWFSPSDFNDDKKILLDSKNKITQVAVDEGKAKIYPSNSLLLVAIGATIGKVGLLKHNATSNQQITAISFNNDVIPDYAYYWFKKLKKYIVKFSPNATLPIINQKGIKNLPFKCPAKTKQESIVNKLDSINEFSKDLIQQQTKKFEHLKSLKSSLLDMAFRGELVE